MARRETSPLAGKTVKIRADVAGLGGQECLVEDWWQNVSGGSWMDSPAPAAFQYAARSSAAGLPIDNDVLYGKVGNFGYLVHVTEVES